MNPEQKAQQETQLKMMMLELILKYRPEVKPEEAPQIAETFYRFVKTEPSKIVEAKLVQITQ